MKGFLWDYYEVSSGKWSASGTLHTDLNCMKGVQTWSFFWSWFSQNVGKYGSEKTPIFGTFYAVLGSHF